ncbi:MAG TPA: hypothetical protein EYP08_03830 [Pyrodictiaceae archaeon]|nr:hypothetical protein [Pyrodictiaceae archaeon]
MLPVCVYTTTTTTTITKTYTVTVTTTTPATSHPHTIVVTVTKTVTAKTKTVTPPKIVSLHYRSTSANADIAYRMVANETGALVHAELLVNIFGVALVELKASMAINETTVLTLLKFHYSLPIPFTPPKAYKSFLLRKTCKAGQRTTTHIDTSYTIFRRTGDQASTYNFYNGHCCTHCNA